MPSGVSRTRKGLYDGKEERGKSHLENCVDIFGDLQGSHAEATPAAFVGKESQFSISNPSLAHVHHQTHPTYLGSIMPCGG